MGYPDSLAIDARPLALRYDATPWSHGGHLFLSRLCLSILLPQLRYDESKRPGRGSASSIRRRRKTVSEGRGITPKSVGIPDTGPTKPGWKSSKS